MYISYINQVKRAIPFRLSEMYNSHLSNTRRRPRTCIVWHRDSMHSASELWPFAPVTRLWGQSEGLNVSSWDIVWTSSSSSTSLDSDSRSSFHALDGWCVSQTSSDWWTPLSVMRTYTPKQIRQPHRGSVSQDRDGCRILTQDFIRKIGCRDSNDIKSSQLKIRITSSTRGTLAQCV